MKQNKQLQLFLSFLKIGAFTFGGGYAMIPLIQKEVVDTKKWLTEKDISDVIAIAETTPGPIAINAATFVGYKTNGVKGALAATTGVVLPSFCIILLIAAFFTRFMEYKVVADAFWGIRIAVTALMCKALLSMFKQCPKHIVSYLMAAAAFVFVGIFAGNALVMIVIAAFVGIISECLKAGGRK